jgi:hypothetical protein
MLTEARRWMELGELRRSSVTGDQVMLDWWDVVPDNERQQWTLEPFISVGPLAFGMSPGEVSEALNGATGETQRHKHYLAPGASRPIVKTGRYQEFGLDLYYREERLSGIVVNALRGPQVFVEGVALVGRVPSVLEQWMVDRHRRADTGEPDENLIYMDPGNPGSESLGVVIEVQRAGDHLLTRPVFIPFEALDIGFTSWLPDKVWGRY